MLLLGSPNLLGIGNEIERADLHQELNGKGQAIEEGAIARENGLLFPDRLERIVHAADLEQRTIVMARGIRRREDEHIADNRFGGDIPLLHASQPTASSPKLGCFICVTAPIRV